MKNLIFISTILAAGTLAATAATPPTGTYEDGNGNTLDFKFDREGNFYALGLSQGTYNNVKIDSNDSLHINVSIYSGVTFEGFTFNVMNAGDFYGGPGSVLGGKIEFSNVMGSNIHSNLSSGTHFSIDSNSQVCFYSNVWDISSANLTQPLVEGTGTVGMSPDYTFTLNFLSAELLKQTQTISLLSAKTQVAGYYSRFQNIAITVDGKAVSNYTATQINGGRDISIKYVPEPSMFSLLAGTLALALAGTRRRRK